MNSLQVNLSAHFTTQKYPKSQISIKSLNINAFGPSLDVSLGNGHLQNAIFEACLNILSIDVIWKGHGAVKSSTAAFADKGRTLLAFSVELGLGAENEVSIAVLAPEINIIL